PVVYGPRARGRPRISENSGDTADAARRSECDTGIARRPSRALTDSEPTPSSCARVPQLGHGGQRGRDGSLGLALLPHWLARRYRVGCGSGENPSEIIVPMTPRLRFPGPLVGLRHGRPDDNAGIRGVNNRAFGEALEANIVDALRSNRGMLLS